jgi:hypothetical protein
MKQDLFKNNFGGKHASSIGNRTFMYWYCCGQLWNLYQTNKLDMKARKKKPTV